MIDPNQFIITRKRKLYKFALFANSPLCFEFDEWQQAQPLQKTDDVTVEVGAGNGLFCVELAARHPERQFVALDVKGDRLQRGARAAEVRGLANVRFVRARADQVAELFDAGSLEQLWLTFSDPFPRKHSSGRRLTNPRFLAMYAQLLAGGGKLYIKHDNHGFFHWSLEQLVAEKWQIDELTFDLHGSDFNDDYKVLTTYEERWLGEGLVTNFARAYKAK